eukprot:scaffold238779_cov60-Attheya_sp.AAC.4
MEIAVLILDVKALVCREKGHVPLEKLIHIPPGAIRIDRPFDDNANTPRSTITTVGYRIGNCGFVGCLSITSRLMRRSLIRWSAPAVRQRRMTICMPSSETTLSPARLILGALDFGVPVPAGHYRNPCWNVAEVSPRV